MLSRRVANNSGTTASLTHAHFDLAFSVVWLRGHVINLSLQFCRADVASSTALIWEGYMGSQQPALLFKQVVNVDPYSSHREERWVGRPPHGTVPSTVCSSTFNVIAMLL